MSHHYRLTYFYFRAKGENIRQILTMAGVEFEDIRVHWDAWQKMKKDMPFGQLPVLEEDGKILPQSRAISRYLAKKYGFAGENEWESAQIDALADQFEDFWQEIRPFYRTYNRLIEGDLDTVYDQVIQPARDKHLPLFEKYLDDSSSGFLVGSKVSWIDTQLADHMHTFTEFRHDYAKRYPKLTEHKRFIHSIPRLREWLENRPHSLI